ncbi:hypothetical protein K435DRAFT_812366 [Dendrothele bispora CBS 962.96]|uniref:Uncharacterized protein n=1 Tax=Dendrothele bispora (strain CBS 962.96) TaxID=1314807 RepID=A0A4V4HB04_DENBC|nr:hypothetical protein K435DRAFT_812366 [Dendrothele bispora CBS 962.96]
MTGGYGRKRQGPNLFNNELLQVYYMASGSPNPAHFDVHRPGHHVNETKTKRAGKNIDLPRVQPRTARRRNFLEDDLGNAAEFEFDICAWAEQCKDTKGVWIVTGSSLLKMINFILEVNNHIKNENEIVSGKHYKLERCKLIVWTYAKQWVYFIAIPSTLSIFSQDVKQIPIDK